MMFNRMKKSCFLFVALLLSLLAVRAQVLPQDPKLVAGVLKNGFHYYIYPNTSGSQQTAIQLFVNAGSLQERDDQRGLAHFVEHMAFNGSKNYPKNEVITFLESLGVKFGADLNAHTSFDETVYKITIDSKEKANLAKALAIVYDWSFNLSFDSLEIEKERGVIIEEWRTKQGVDARMSDQTLPLIFYNSRYAERQPIGTLDILHHFQRPTIVDFYQSWYRPSLLGLAIVTNQDVKETEKLVKNLFGKAKDKKQAPKREAYTLKEHQDTLFKVYTDKEANSIDFSYITKLPASNAVKTKADFLTSMQHRVVNSLLKKRFDRLAQLDNEYKSASMSFADLLLHNGLSIGGSVLYEDHIESGIRKFLLEKERLVRYGFTKQEIDDYKKQYQAQLERAQPEKEVHAGLMLASLKNSFFTGELLLDKEYSRMLTLSLLDKIDSVSLQQHLSGYFKPGNTVVILSGPTRLAQALPTQERLSTLFAEAAHAKVSPWKDQVEIPEQLLPELPTAGQVVRKSFNQAIDLHTWTLSNGAKVYLKKSAGRKEHIQLTAFRKGGVLALDSADYVNGIYAKDIIGASGAGDFSRQALTKYLNGNSASSVFVLSQHREGLSASASMKDMKTMFELLYLKWTQPRVDATVFANFKKKALDAAKEKVYNVTTAYYQAIGKAVGADDNENNEILADRIAKDLQLDRIVPVFKERFQSASDFDFVLIGDFDVDTLQPYIEQYIGALPAGAYTKAQRKPSYSQSANQDILLYAGEADKATVNLFFQTTDVQYDYPAILLNELMENVLKVKLRKNLREEHSGVYGVSVKVNATSEPANLIRTQINFSCEPARKDFLIDQVFVELAKIAKDPNYFTEELENAKTQMIQTYANQYNKETFWSAELRNHIYFQFANWNYFTDYKKMVQAISAADISTWTQEKVNKATQVKAVLMPERFKK